MPATTYTGNKIIDLLVRGVAFTAPDRVYLSLHTGDPGLTGTNEVTLAAWPAYSRLDCAAGGAIATGFAAAAAKETKNAKQLLFPAQDGSNPITVSHWAIWDAATGGNCLWTGALEFSKTLDPTDEVVVHINELTLTVN